MFGWELATAPPRNVRIAGFAAWGRGGKPKAGQSSGEDPKAKPFFCDNSANKNVIDWISGQLSARACFVPGLYVSLLLRPSTPPRATPSTALHPCPMPIHGAVSVSHADPWRCIRAPYRSMALPRSRPEGSKQKIGLFCNFLRLGIVTDPCNRRLGRKSAGGLLQSGCFRLCGGRGESLIAKKLQKRSDFCFCGRWIAAAGQISQRADHCGGADCAKSWFSVGRIRPHPFCCAFCLRRCYSLCNGMRAFFGWLQRCGVDCMWGFRCA